MQEKLTLAVAYIADIKAYMDKELAKAGQTLHRDDIDDLLTQEYEAYQTLKKTHTPEAYERVGAIHERIKNYELEETQFPELTRDLLCEEAYASKRLLDFKKAHFSAAFQRMVVPTNSQIILVINPNLRFL